MNKEQPRIKTQRIMKNYNETLDRKTLQELRKTKRDYNVTVARKNAPQRFFRCGGIDAVGEVLRRQCYGSLYLLDDESVNDSHILISVAKNTSLEEGEIDERLNDGSWNRIR